MGLQVLLGSHRVSGSTGRRLARNTFLDLQRNIGSHVRHGSTDIQWLALPPWVSRCAVGSQRRSGSSRRARLALDPWFFSRRMARKRMLVLQTFNGSHTFTGSSALFWLASRFWVFTDSEARRPVMGLHKSSGSILINHPPRVDVPFMPQAVDHIGPVGFQPIDATPRLP